MCVCVFVHLRNYGVDCFVYTRLRNDLLEGLSYIAFIITVKEQTE